MDEREVKSKSDALTKAVAAKEPAANILNLLRDLQKGVKPSEELLRKTQVGRVVNKLKTTQGVDPQIPQLASTIVSQWRNEIKRNTGAGTPPRTNGNASPITAPSKEPSKPDVKSDSKLPTGVPLDKRTYQTDKVDIKHATSEDGRNKTVGLLYNGLVTGSSLPPPKVLEVARATEQAIMSLPESKSSQNEFYKEKVRSLYQNLKNKSHPELRTRILSGQISPERFATMTHEEMKSDTQKLEEAKIAKENLNNAMVPEEKKSISDSLECGKCKKKMVSFTQAQTRSADEPMTTFCNCENCGNRWKFS